MVYFQKQVLFLQGTLLEDTVNYTCDPGYKLLGPKLMTCSPDGQWESSDSAVPTQGPRCQATTCPKPQEVAGMSVTGVTGEDLPYGSLLSFTCSRENHVLRGPGELICGEDGKWSGPEPE